MTIAAAVASIAGTAVIVTASVVTHLLTRRDLRRYQRELHDCARQRTAR